MYVRVYNCWYMYDAGTVYMIRVQPCMPQRLGDTKQGCYCQQGFHAVTLQSPGVTPLSSPTLPTCTGPHCPSPFLTPLAVT